jgi:hypothetical protein
MKEQKKDKEKGAKSPEKREDDLKKLDRGAFLKALGVGIGAVGLDMVAGTPVSARTAPELEDGRMGIQKLMRGLLENPRKAEEFVDNPLVVAREFGVHLTEGDAKKIQETLMKLALQAGDRLATMPGHQDWTHSDGTWHDTYNKTVTPKKAPKGTTTPTTPPTGGKRKQN